MNTPTTPPTPDTPDTPDTTLGTEDTTYLPQSPETRVDDSLADEVFVDDSRTAPLPTTVPPAATATPATGAPTATMTATAPATASSPAPSTPPEPTYLSGPAPFALVLGLLGLLVAGSVLVNELTDISLPWGDLGPWSVVAAGLVVLLVGAIGLRSSRNRG
jgi:hypothetical protein